MSEDTNEQEMFYRFSIFEKQIREIQQQIEAIDKGIVEISSLNMGLDELIGATGKEIFAPIGRGIFAKAKLISEELHVDIGEGNIVKKSIPETKELILEQIKKLEQVKKELGKTLEGIEKEMEQVIKNIQEKEGSHEHEHLHEGHKH